MITGTGGMGKVAVLGLLLWGWARIARQCLMTPAAVRHAINVIRPVVGCCVQIPFGFMWNVPTIYPVLRRQIPKCRRMTQLEIVWPSHFCLIPVCRGADHPPAPCA